MERKPLSSTSPESSQEGSDASDKKESSSSKKKTLRHVPLSAMASEAPARDQEEPKKSLFDYAKAEKVDKPEAAKDMHLDAEQAEVAKTSEEEKEHVEEQVIASHIEAIEAVDDQTAEALQPARDYLALRKEQGMSDEEASAQVLGELGMDDAEIAEVLEASPDEIDTLYLEDEPADTGPEDASTETTIESDDEMRDEDEIMISPPATGGGAGGSGGGSGPGGPTGPVSPENEPPVPPGPALARTTVTSVAPALANRMPTPAVIHFENRRAQAGQLLLVGLVGYLIGRRRGRIKTEKRLLPVQKKLEKEVAAVEQKLTFREQQLVAAKAALQERQKFTSKTEAVRQAKAPTEQRMQPGRTETRLGLEKPARVEQLGHMVVAAEAPKVIERTVEKRVMERPNNLRQGFRAEQVKTMPRAELLEVSEKIIVEGASLRQIYETNLIGEKQLRHIVGEYLQGKDIHKALQREMVEHEIDFERDPMMRDRVHGETTSGRGGGLGDMLSKAGIVDNAPNTQMERQIQKEMQRREAAERKQQQQRMAMDIAMVTAVTVLAIVVAVLALRG